MIRNFEELLALWTPAQLARALPCPYQTAVAMHARGSIGPRHWARLIELAPARGVSLTAEDLIRLHDLKMSQPSTRPRSRAPTGRPTGRPPKAKADAHLFHDPPSRGAELNKMHTTRTEQKASAQSKLLWE